MSVDDPARARTHAPPVEQDEPAPCPAAPRLTVRLHTRRPRTVLARVAGPVDESSAAVITETIAAPFGTVVHVVVDLSEVTTLTQAGVRTLLDLDRAATRRGTQLHVTGTRHPHNSHHVAGHLLRLGADHLLRRDRPPGAPAHRPR